MSAESGEGEHVVTLETEERMKECGSRGELFSGRSHEAQSASLAADRRPFSRSATGSTRSMPISPELRVHGSPPRRFCWPWLRGAGGKRRVKLGLSDSEATLRPG